MKGKGFFAMVMAITMATAPLPVFGETLPKAEESTEETTIDEPIEDNVVLLPKNGPVTVTTEDQLKDVLVGDATEIVLGSNIHLSSGVTIPNSKTVTIDGNNYAVTVNQSNAIFVITTDGNLTLKNITLDGENRDHKQALLRNEGTLLLDNTTVKNGCINSRNNHGAGIWSSGILTIQNESKILGNKILSLGGNGGGIYQNGGTITISNSEISGNEVTNNNNSNNNHGGGIFQESGTLIINDSKISNNKASNRGSNGGGIFSNDILTISNSIISNNQAANGSNGGILSNGTFKSTKTTLSNNNVTISKLEQTEAPAFILQPKNRLEFLNPTTLTGDTLTLQLEEGYDIDDTIITGVDKLIYEQGAPFDISNLTLWERNKHPLLFEEQNNNIVLLQSSDPIYDLTVNEGTSDGYEYTSGSEVTVKANPPTHGFLFDHWDIDAEVTFLENTTPKNSTIKFSMPEQYVTLTAVYRENAVSVIGGTGSGNYNSGEVVTVTADTPKGFVLDHWDIDSDVTLLDDTTLESPEIKFYMPSHSVTLTAVYRENTVLVTGGTGSGNYDVGEVVTITAEVPKGFVFDHWESETVLEFTENTSETDETAKFIMGDRPVEITAIFTEQEDENKRRNDGRVGTLYYSITAEPTNHGTITADPQRATRGQSVTVTVLPDNGYLLDTISITEQNGTAIDFTQESENIYTFAMPKAKVTVSAAFTEDGNLPIPEPTHTPEKTMLPFSDVLETDWYYDAVCSIYESNIMSGTTETTFSPNEPTSRGMLVTILYRMNGEIYPNEETIFTDVSTNMYYNTAVAWAVDKGIASGMGDGLFSPDTSITREQLAVFLYQYALYKGNAPSTEGMAIREFTDTDKISSWAAPAIQYCLNSGILSGKPDGTFSPRDNATRAEVASVLVRFLQP